MSLLKDLTTVAGLTGHTPVSGRPNPISGATTSANPLSFGPMALFAAAARTSHLHAVNPYAVSPELLTIQALIENYVDDTTLDFFILDHVKRLKDFYRGYFAGVVASGIGYLYMLSEGYVWSDHFENQTPRGNPDVGTTPDFVFARPGVTGVALMESKGTLSAVGTRFDRVVADGYVRQIEPHLGYNVGGAVAECGFAVGSWLTPPPSGGPIPPGPAAELYIHYTTVPAAPPPARPAGTGDASSLSGVKLGNYATAFSLAFGPVIGEALRRRQLRPVFDPTPVSWFGREWVSSLRPVGGETPGAPEPHPLGPPVFLIEKRIADEVLNFAQIGNREEVLHVDPLPGDLVVEANRLKNAALFRDGVAIVRRQLVESEPFYKTIPPLKSFLPPNDRPSYNEM